MARKFFAEMLGTAILVFFAVGVATLSFGFGLFGGSYSAGVIATALAFGLTLMALAYVLGPISGCHVNPAVTIGAFFSGRISLTDAASYWVAQFIGGILGASLAPYLAQILQGWGGLAYVGHYITLAAAVSTAAIG